MKIQRKRNAHYEVKPALINPQASVNARRLMKYLCDMYGERILSGQQAPGLNPAEIKIVHQETGKYPAVCGFDFMDYSPSRVEFGTSSDETEAAIAWWQEGGIVTFSWHWNAPKDLPNEPPDAMWYSGFYTRATTFDIAKAMNDRTSEDYALIIRDIDAIAVQLKKLQDHDIPVLWRPLHEASGAWFWWGAKGPGPCIMLWRLMYERLTHHHGLHNLIWVWNGQAKDWYPGDEYVDIIGEDVYDKPGQHTSLHERFEQALSYTNESKIIALSENGPIPDPDLLLKDDVLWSWFCTWCGGFVYVQEDDKTTYSESHTKLDKLKKFYSHPLVITREQLPDLKSYPL
ncbi:glycoside hydrolase family 26 protein [Paenibacillus spongiae]|uniref:Glycoside hydrolase family 26 protein n=1 Tax=Paenibacillus spongiae TaxID=2909671 RepID=A0ABY5SI98_9BACL|nr:glycoside hydrolase family 26 protein [Paenibacillus spongiae]UVI31978.1 glycoside hydrolase family 26 protein [Paenibacillus spongiae]